MFACLIVSLNIERLNVYENDEAIYDLFFTMSHGVNRGKLKTDKTDARYPFLNQLVQQNMVLM